MTAEEKAARVADMLLRGVTCMTCHWREGYNWGDPRMMVAGVPSHRCRVFNRHFPVAETAPRICYRYMEVAYDKR